MSRNWDVPHICCEQLWLKCRCQQLEKKIPRLNILLLQSYRAQTDTYEIWRTTLCQLLNKLLVTHLNDWFGLVPHDMLGQNWEADAPKYKDVQVFNTAWGRGLYTFPTWNLVPWDWEVCFIQDRLWKPKFADNEIPRKFRGIKLLQSRFSMELIAENHICGMMQLSQLESLSVRQMMHGESWELHNAWVEKE